MTPVATAIEFCLTTQHPLGGGWSDTTYPPTTSPRTPPPPTPPPEVTGQIFLHVFGQSKFCSGAFGASQFRPKIFFSASNDSGSPGGGGGGSPPPPRPPLAKL